MRFKPLTHFIFLTAILLVFSSIVVQKASCDNPRETPVVKVVRENAGAVVNISTEHIILLRENPAWGNYGSEFDFLFDQFFGLHQRTRALKLNSVGSGVVVDSNGIIVTNAHVVHMASNIFVVLNDGTSVAGKVVYENPREDLALIRVDPPKPLKAVSLGQDDDVMIGETVVAIGNPLGLENSVSAGVISGKDREVYSSRDEKVSEGLIQTDAPINPGNSGGALFNLAGELIGINVAVVQNSQSIGFAIPVKKVRRAIDAHQRNDKFTIRQRGGSALAPAVSQERTAPLMGEDEWESQRFHSFLRTIPLPLDADSTTVTTDVEGNDLVIRIKKRAAKAYFPWRRGK